MGTDPFHRDVHPTSFDSEIAVALSQISVKSKLMATFKESVAAF